MYCMSHLYRFVYFLYNWSAQLSQLHRSARHKRNTFASFISAYHIFSHRFSRESENWTCFKTPLTNCERVFLSLYLLPGGNVTRAQVWCCNIDENVKFEHLCDLQTQLGWTNTSLYKTKWGYFVLIIPIFIIIKLEKRNEMCPLLIVILSLLPVPFVVEFPCTQDCVCLSYTLWFPPIV